MTTRSSATTAEFGELKQGNLDGVTPVCPEGAGRSTSYAMSWRGWAAAMFAAAATLVAPGGQAQLKVDISGVGATQYPIAIADFSGHAQGRNVSEIIRADLSRSGQFRLINATGSNLSVESQVSFSEWSGRGADYLAYGSVTEAGGQYNISYRLV